MRKTLLSTVASLAIFLPLQAHAAEIDQAGADQIKEKLTYYLPTEIVDTGFIKVVPAANRYELSVDLMPLLKDVKPEMFTISGLKPFIHYLTPQDDGMWKVEVNDRFDVNGSFKAEGKKQDFTYKIDNMVFDGLFDPTITYFTTGKYTLDKLAFNSIGDDANIAVTVDAMGADMKGDKIAEGIVDLSGTLSMSNFQEAITEKSGDVVSISADSMSGTIEFKRLGVNAFRDLLVFGLDLVKADVKKLDQAQADTLKSLIRANMPLTDKFDEQLVFNGVKVAAQGMNVSFDSFTYGLGFTGLKKDASARFNMGVTKPVIPAGLLPPGTEGAIPDAANFAVAISNLNLEGVVTYMLDNADFTKPDPLTPAQSDELGRIVLPDGKLHIDFTDVYARSAVYDLSLAGQMQVNPDNSDKPSVDVTITAKDLDKTIKYLQDNAQTVPEFGQASFMVLMMKGFGKVETDGSTVWNVKLDETGKVTINGQEMKI
ncbi:MAG: putative virulence factor [Rhizobium sp.]|nr:putative virulence factor [Rhizobium sp.]